MLGKALIALAAGAVLSLAACRQQAQQAAGGKPAPAVTAQAPSPAPTPTPASSTPTISLDPGSATVTVTPAPTPCGAEKLADYLNLLPTSMAKDEIARAAGHRNIRYVPLKPPPTLDERARLTAELGVDGRIKKFACG